VLGGPFGVEPIEDSMRRLDRFAEVGGRLVETAHSYKEGRAEQAIGAWFEANPGVLEVLSKAGHDPVTKADIPLDAETVEQHVRESLDALNVDRLDVFLYHTDDPSRSVDELAATLIGLIDGGLARSVGASNWPLERFAQLTARLRSAGHDLIGSYQYGLASPDPAQLKPGNLAADSEILQFLEAEQVPLFAWSAQAGGFFARTGPAQGESRSYLFETSENAERRERCRALAAEFGTAPSTLALAWTLHRSMTWAAIGPRSAEQLDGSLEALGLDLTYDQVRWLEYGDE
jgi:aryl-alcohol dehydrogenase-like predicted oxidoreductase